MQKENDDSRYINNGYKDRDDYLATLADGMGIGTMAVNMIADMLGPAEDFDGLVSELEDFAGMGLCDGDDSEELQRQCRNTGDGHNLCFSPQFFYRRQSMSKMPNTKLYKECPNCRAWFFGQYDVFCSRCGAKLEDGDALLAGISDYAKSMLIDFLDDYPDLAQRAYISEIPDYATEGIRANGNIMFSQAATRHVLAECWNEVEIALDDWRETNGSDFPVKNIEQLHVFAVTQHAEMIWRNLTSDFPMSRMDEEAIAESIDRLKCR
jgi:hypothetical protein